MDFLTLESILERALPEEEIEVPAWGGAVKIRAITSSELERATRDATDRRGETEGFKLNAIIICKGLIEPKIEDHPRAYLPFMNKEPGPINDIAQAILKLSGLSEKDMEAGEA